MQNSTSGFQGFHEVARIGREQHAVRQIVNTIILKSDRSIPVFLNEKACTFAVKENYASLSDFLEEKLFFMCWDLLKRSAHEIAYTQSDIRTILQVTIALYFKKVEGEDFSESTLECHVKRLREMKQAMPVITLEHFHEGIFALMNAPAVVHSDADSHEQTVAQGKVRSAKSPKSYGPPKRSLRDMIAKNEEENRQRAKCVEQKRNSSKPHSSPENDGLTKTYRTIEEITTMVSLGRERGFSEEEILSKLRLPFTSLEKMRMIFQNYLIADIHWEELRETLSKRGETPIALVIDSSPDHKQLVKQYRTIDEIADMYAKARIKGYSDKQIASGLKLPYESLKMMQERFQNYPIANTDWEQMRIALLD